MRASCHGTEEPDRVASAMAQVAGVPVAELPLDRTELESHHGGLVTILEAKLDKSRAARDVLARLLALPEAAALVAAVESRTDDDGVFYARVDKQAAYQGRLVLTNGEDCVQLRFKPEVHPATREAAIAAMRDAMA